MPAWRVVGLAAAAVDVDELQAAACFCKAALKERAKSLATAVLPVPTGPRAERARGSILGQPAVVELSQRMASSGPGRDPDVVEVELGQVAEDRRAASSSRRGLMVCMSRHGAYEDFSPARR